MAHVNHTARALSDSFRKTGWPNWTSAVTEDARNPLTFTVKITSTYRTRIVEEEPTKLYNQAMTYLRQIQDMIEQDPDHRFQILEQSLAKEMINVVFGSNNIERAGLDLGETMRICEKIFNGEHIDAATFNESSPEYQAQLAAFVHKTTNTSKEHVIRSRREVIQHAQALQHITKVMVIEGKPLTEELILETHRILCADIDVDNDEGGISAATYAGKYRTIPVRAGNCGFVPPKFVPSKMREMIETYNKDIVDAESTATLDPFYLAAKYCNDFVLIHPFVDGNGRMCRLIMNAIMLRYAGIMVAIGGHDDERREYLDIARRSSEYMEGCGELATMLLRKATGRLRTLKKKLHGKHDNKTG